MVYKQTWRLRRNDNEPFAADAPIFSQALGMLHPLRLTRTVLTHRSPAGLVKNNEMRTTPRDDGVRTATAHDALSYSASQSCTTTV